MNTGIQELIAKATDEQKTFLVGFLIQIDLFALSVMRQAQAAHTLTKGTGAERDLMAVEQLARDLSGFAGFHALSMTNAVEQERQQPIQQENAVQAVLH